MPGFLRFSYSLLGFFSFFFVFNMEKKESKILFYSLHIHVMKLLMRPTLIGVWHPQRTLMRYLHYAQDFLNVVGLLKECTRNCFLTDQEDSMEEERIRVHGLCGIEMRETCTGLAAIREPVNMPPKTVASSFASTISILLPLTGSHNPRSMTISKSPWKNKPMRSNEILY